MSCFPKAIPKLLCHTVTLNTQCIGIELQLTSCNKMRHTFLGANLLPILKHNTLKLLGLWND